MDSSLEDIEIEIQSDENIKSFDEDEMRKEEKQGGTKNGRRDPKTFIRRHLLMILLLLGIIVGFILGFCIRLAKPSPDVIMWTGLPGEMFMRMMKVMILPLITGTLIKGAYVSDPKHSGRLSGFTVGFCLISNIIGTLVGIGFFLIFKPGSDVTVMSNFVSGPKTYKLQSQDLFADLIRNILPDNVVTATIQKTQTRYLEVSTGNQNASHTTYRRSVGTADGTNILGLVVLLTLVGFAAGRLGEQGRKVVDFFHTISRIFVILMEWFIWYSPIGVTSLIATSIASVNDLEATFSSIAMYVLAFTLGILTEIFIGFPILYFAVVRKNPFSFLLSMTKILVIAFSPPSALITIPNMIKLCEDRHNIKSSIAGFVVPICATSCRYGSALFISMTSLFLMVLEGVALDGPNVLLIGILTVVGSFAVPSMPSGSVVAIIVIISSLNVDSTSIGIIMAMEWYTDRLRTMTNVVGMLSIPAMIDRFQKEKVTYIQQKAVPEDEDNQTTALNHV